MNKKQYQKFEAAQRHIKNLKRLFPRLRRLEDADALEILYRLETKQRRAAVAYCNGDIDAVTYELVTKRTEDKVTELLGNKVKPILKTSGDPRGYALKLDEEWSQDKQIYRYWGSYGIICPEF